jgi:small-conductance mechanosensitive channel
VASCFYGPTGMAFALKIFMDFLKSFHLSWQNLVAYMPSLLGGIICFVVTIFVSGLLTKVITKYALRRSHDPLISNFIGKIIWSVMFIMGTVLALGILGLGVISDKILAGAGITTFVIGFALKDIGENFLAGIILAFSRPYKVGNLIECNDVKGVVRTMTMRQTTVEAENGKIILIPNSAIINNPLIKYLNDDNNLRQEFGLSVDSDKIKEATKVIINAIVSFEYVLNEKDKQVKVVVEGLAGEKVKLLVIYWFDKIKFNGSRSGTRTWIMRSVFEKLNEAGIKYSE